MMLRVLDTMVFGRGGWGVWEMERRGVRRDGMEEE